MTTLGAPAGLPISGSGCLCGGACELRLSYPACSRCDVIRVQHGVMCSSME